MSGHHHCYHSNSIFLLISGLQQELTEREGWGVEGGKWTWTSALRSDLVRAEDARGQEEPANSSPIGSEISGMKTVCV